LWRALRRLAYNGRLDEGDGWVNWSGLATQLANIEKAVVGKVDRFFLSLRLHQPHQDVERLTGEVVLRAL